MTLTRPMGTDFAFPNASDYRKQLAAIYPRKGVFPSPTTVDSAGIAYAGSGWGINARAFGAAVKRGDGAYAMSYGTATLSNDSVVTNAWTINPAPTSGTRVDILCILARDVTQGDSATGTPNDGPNGANRSGIPEFVTVSGATGTPGIRPAVPSGYLEIAEVTTPSGATGAAGSTIVPTYAFAQVVGGPIYVRTSSDVAGLASAILGDVAIALDTGLTWRYNGTRWGRYGQKVAGMEGSYNEGSAYTLNPGATYTVATMPLPVPSMRGAVVRMFLSTYIYVPVNAGYAGYLRFAIGNTQEAARRWHSQNRGGVLMPSAMVEFKLPTDFSGPVNAALRITSDSVSSGAVDVYNTFGSMVYDYLGE